MLREKIGGFLGLFVKCVYACGYTASSAFVCEGGFEYADEDGEMPSIFSPSHPEHELRKPHRGEVRWMLGRNIWTGVLGNIGLVYMTGGVFFVAYCQEMGMQKHHFGILRALVSLMMPLMLLSPAI